MEADYDKWLDRQNPTTNYEGLTKRQMDNLKFNMEVELVTMDLEDLTQEEYEEEVNDVKRKFMRQGLLEEIADELIDYHHLEL